MSLEGTVAIVTGASRGIGAGIAKLVEELGGVDILVNNDAILVPGTIEPVRWWDRCSHRGFAGRRSAACP